MSVGSLESLITEEDAGMEATSTSVSSSSTASSSTSGSSQDFFADEDDLLKSFSEPGHAREDSSEPTVPMFESPRFTLDLERSLSPMHHSKAYRSQLELFHSGRRRPSAGPGEATSSSEEDEEEEEDGDITRLWLACERALPHCAHQLLSITSPERRRILANAPSTSESPCGPLHAACRRANTLLVKILLASGASPELRSAEGLTPLHYAVEGGSLEILSILLGSAKGDDAKLIRLLEGALSSPAGFTPLSAAARQGNIQLARELLTRTENLPAPLGRRLKRRFLKARSEVEAQELQGTPLEIATRNGHREMVLFLLNQGADPLVMVVDYAVAWPMVRPVVTLVAR